MARTARSGRLPRAILPGGRHDHCHLHESLLRSPVSCACVPDAWACSSCCSWPCSPVGGFWVLSTFGKKVVTAPVESLIQPSWIKEAVAYAPEDKATKAAAAPPDRSAEIMRQLAAMQQDMQSQREALEALKKRPVTPAPAAEGRHRLPRLLHRSRTGRCCSSVTI